MIEIRMSPDGILWRIHTTSYSPPGATIASLVEVDSSGAQQPRGSQRTRQALYDEAATWPTVAPAEPTHAVIERAVSHYHTTSYGSWIELARGSLEWCRGYASGRPAGVHTERRVVVLPHTEEVYR